MASPEVEPHLGETHDIEKVSDSFQESASSLIMTEEQAFAKARANPNEALAILVTYGSDDLDNPRNWPKWQKWYISIFASMLNVLTYVESP